MKRNLHNYSFGKVITNYIHCLDFLPLPLLKNRHLEKKKQDALDYHSSGRKGKIEISPTKPYSSQRDLSLAYSPGVAQPCLEIDRDKSLVYEYTAKGNLVAVISNPEGIVFT